jgi:hypothetical protein
MGMHIPDKNQLISLVIVYGLSSMFVLFGAFTYELYVKRKGFNYRIAIDRLVMSTLVGSMAALFMIGELGDRLSFAQSLALSYVTGLLGFQILIKISKLEFWEGIIDRFFNKR